MQSNSVSEYSISGVALVCELAFELSAAISDLSRQHLYTVHARVCLCLCLCACGVVVVWPEVSMTKARPCVQMVWWCGGVARGVDNEGDHAVFR